MATKIIQPSILDLIKRDPRYSQRRSVDWFKTKIASLGGNSPVAKTELLETTKSLQTNMVIPGAMHFFSYDPKHKEELPFYDKFPLSLVFGLTETGFIGINFHMLSYEMRGKLFDKISLISNQYHNNREQVLRLNWKLFSNVSKFPEAQVAVRQYLYSHVRSRFIKVPVDDWKTALFLPVENFAKKSQAWIARYHAQKIRKLR